MIAVVTDVRYRMSLALIRDLSEAGVTVVTCEGERCRGSAASPALGALSRHTSRHVWLPEGQGTQPLWQLCRQLTEERGERPALLPVGAATLAALAADRERFDAVCGLCIPTPAQLALFNSKERLAALAAGLDVPVPESFVRSPGEPAEAFIRRLPLPCVIKPVCGEKLGLTAAQRYAIVRSPEEAEAHYRRFAALGGEEPVVQAYLTGPGLGCDLVADRGEIAAAICHRRLREYPVTGGPSSCCRCVERPDLLDYAARLVRETGYTGLAMFEFKEDAAGRPHLLEANPRVRGTFPLTRISRSGIPLLWALLSYNAGNPGAPISLPEVPAPLQRKMIFAASDLMAGVGYARRGRPGQLLAALGDLLNPAVRDGLFEWGDMLPGLAYYRSLIAKEKHG